MAEKLKNLFFTKDTINNFAVRLKEVYQKFDKDKFIHFVYDEDWEIKELKAKMRHVAICLHDCLPQKYDKAIDILINIAPNIKGFEGMVLPDYVELYGLDNVDVSLRALKEFTKHSSSEFAIRPFIMKDVKGTMAFLLELAKHENENVRRFASEGCRPRLPWAMALLQFKKDPSPIIPILEKLKDDESEFVRRSVANNLNDISKDNPEIVLELGEKWIGKSDRTDWIIKHACRTMLKSGDKRALRLFGYGNPEQINVQNFEVKTKVVKIGDYLKFSFKLNVKSSQESKLRLEYAIDYLKANHSHNKKIFQISENTYPPGDHFFSKKHSFAEMSTRKHYPGLHKISIVVNGERKSTQSFQVK